MNWSHLYFSILDFAPRWLIALELWALTVSGALMTLGGILEWSVRFLVWVRSR